VPEPSEETDNAIMQLILLCLLGHLKRILNVLFIVIPSHDNVKAITSILLHFGF